MFCPNCGKEIEDGSRFCMHCGKKILVVSETVSESPKKKKRVLLPVLSGICLLIAFMAVLIVLHPWQTKGSPANKRVLKSVTTTGTEGTDTSSCTYQKDSNGITASFSGEGYSQTYYYDTDGNYYQFHSESWYDHSDGSTDHMSVTQEFKDNLTVRRERKVTGSSTYYYESLFDYDNKGRLISEKSVIRYSDEEEQTRIKNYTEGRICSLEIDRVQDGSKASVSCEIIYEKEGNKYIGKINTGTVKFTNLSEEDQDDFFDDMPEVIYTYTYDGDQVATFEDSTENMTTEYLYFDNGRVERVIETASDGTKDTVEYDADGYLLKTTTDFGGSVTSTVYDYIPFEEAIRAF